MKRKKVISASNSSAKITVEIIVAANRKELRRDEVDSLLHAITSGTMRVVENAPFVSVPISKMKIR